MLKLNFKKRLVEIEERKAEIRSVLEGDEEVNLDELETELRTLHDEKEAIEKRYKVASGIGVSEVRKIEKPDEGVKVLMKPEEVLSTQEYRTGYLKTLQGKQLDEVEQRALTTGSSSAGAAVPTETMNMIIDKLRQTSVLFPLINVSFIPGKVSLVVANAKNAAAWKAEGTDGTPADDTVVEVNLAGYELIKLVEISAAAKAMTIPAFEQYIVSELGRQMGIAIENAILNGEGGSENQPEGIIDSITWGSSNSTTYANGGAVGYDDIVELISLLPTMYHQNATFVMSRDMFWKGIRKIKDENEQPIFTYNPQDSVANRVFGYPVVINDYIDAEDILFGDFNYYYMNFAEPVAIETSREASFKSGKVTFRGLAVADGKVALDEAFVYLTEADEV